MNVLAYACNPARGGEEGIGFNWLHEWPHTGHGAWGLTTPAGRPGFTAFVYHLGPGEQACVRLDCLYRWQFGGDLLYIVWQFLAWRLTQHVAFDLVHRASHGSLHMASWRWRPGLLIIALDHQGARAFIPVAAALKAPATPPPKWGRRWPGPWSFAATAPRSAWRWGRSATRLPVPKRGIYVVYAYNSCSPTCRRLRRLASRAYPLGGLAFSIYEASSFCICLQPKSR